MVKSLNNGMSNMATVIATAKAALQALVAQGIVQCGGSSSKGKGGSRRTLRRLKKGRTHHRHLNHKHHHRHHHHHHERRRLNLDPNVIGNVLFDVDNCIEDTPGVYTCTGTAQAFLKGDASDEAIGQVISDYLHNPTFLTDSGLGQIASSFAASDARRIPDLPDLPDVANPQSDAGSRGDPHCKSFFEIACDPSCQ